MRLSTVDELKGPEITSLRRHLVDVPYRVQISLTIEESSHRIMSMMLFVPMSALVDPYGETGGSQVALATALHGFQGELRRVVPSYIAPLGLTCVSATETSGTTIYSIEHTPGVVVQ
ncbi:hypothetical protein [Rhodopirellula baltica]